jgi:hypothetical protein
VPGHSGNPARQHNEAATEDQTIDKMSHEASDGDRPHRRNRRRQIRKFGHTVFVITQRMSFVETDFMIGYQVGSTIGSTVIYFLLSRERIGL